MSSSPTRSASGASASGQRIAISGAGGLVGSALQRELERDGATVFPLVRRHLGGDQQPRTNRHDILWDPSAGLLDPEQAERLDAVVHLAGESIAGVRWSEAKKRRIHESRGPATVRLVDDLGKLANPPRAFVCASASGVFGDRGDERLYEDSQPGDTFLADVCKLWERAAKGAEAFAERVIITRLGVVLSTRGGALEQMVTPFRLGLGGRLGSGEQFFPWITLEDVVGALRFVLTSDVLSGPVHLVAPHEVTNLEFTAALGKALHRPTLIPAPAIGLRLLLGEVADALLLSSARLVPRKLGEAEFAFSWPHLPDALQHLLA